MTINERSLDEAIQHAREVAEIQRNNDKLNKTLGKSSPYYNTDCIKCAEEHEQLAELLEELKAIKEMDLDIPQHFTKEQSDWIKAYCIRRNIEFYNKAIDDFAKKLKLECREHYVDCEHILVILQIVFCMKMILTK